MWFALSGVAVGVIAASGWLVISVVARRMTVDLTRVFDGPLTVKRDETRCWSCNCDEATSDDGLCTKCSGGLLHVS